MVEFMTAIPMIVEYRCSGSGVNYTQFMFV
jgi:hypothetical protein